MSSKKYYKVVRKDLCSSMMGKYVNLFGKDFCIQYKIGKFVKPKIKYTSLMIFETYEQAGDFVYKYDYDDGRIFEVEAKCVRKVGIIEYLCSDYFGRKVRKMIRLKRAKKAYTHLTSSSPNGTLFASEVKLVKEVVMNG